MAEFETQSVEQPSHPVSQDGGASDPNDVADGRLLVAELAADDGGESFSYEIVGEGADIFEMTGDALFVRRGAEEAFRAVPEHDLVLRITDITGEVFDEPITIDVSSVPEPEDGKAGDDMPESAGLDGPEPDPFAVAERAASDALAALSGSGPGDEGVPAVDASEDEPADHLPLEPETARVEMVAAADDEAGDEAEIPGPTAVLESDPDAEQAALAAELDAADVSETPVPAAESFYGADVGSDRAAEDMPEDTPLHDETDEADADEATVSQETAFDEPQPEPVSTLEDDSRSEEPVASDDDALAETDDATEVPVLADEHVGEPSEELPEAVLSEEVRPQEDLQPGAGEPTVADDDAGNAPANAEADAADLVRVIEEADPSAERPFDDMPYAAFADTAPAADETASVADDATPVADGSAHEEQQPARYEEPVAQAEEEVEHEFGKYYFYLGPDGHFVISELADDAPELANGVAEVTLTPHYADPEPDLFGDGPERQAPPQEPARAEAPPAPVRYEPEPQAVDPLETPAIEPIAEHADTPANEPMAFETASASDEPSPDESFETPTEPAEGAMRYEVDDDRFFVDEEGNVMLTDGAAFDAEAESSVDLEVTARAPDGSVSHQTFTIDVSEFV